MDLSQGIKYALEGRPALFTGAGFSIGAEGLRGGIKRSAELIEHFAALTGFSKDDGLESLSEEYVEQNGRDALIRDIRDEFWARAVTEAQKAIARIPWRRIYTTNYDDVYGTTAAQVGKAVASVSLSQKPGSVPKGPRDATLVVHLNGSVRFMTRGNVLSEIKLTGTSYLSSIEDSPWLFAV